MPLVKKLYLFILNTFLPLFLMTFFISLFVLLMQFLWKYVDELVGKGIEVGVLAELFFYAALTIVPMALPLSMLLASLMTFGNLGERLELLAIKAAGISLRQTMHPLIIAVIFIAIGAFFFQNNVLPKAQVKMYALLFSVRQKSPELDIPEGVFYDQISGYNLLVKEKDRNTGMLYDLMIYDFSEGFDNAMVILADSGKLSFTDDKQYLFFTLYSGESFENLRDQRRAAGATGDAGIIWIEEMLPRTELIAVLAAGTAFLCPSVYEPLGIVNLEAMAVGLPVVASATGGIPEVVDDGVTGILVPIEQVQDGTGTPLDPRKFVADLSAAMLDMLADPQRQLYADGLMNVNRYVWTAGIIVGAAWLMRTAKRLRARD